MTFRVPIEAINIHALYSDHAHKTEAGYLAVLSDVQAAAALYPEPLLTALPVGKRAAAISYAASGGDATAMQALLEAEDWPGCIDLLLAEDSPRRREEANRFTAGCGVSLARLRALTAKAPPPPVDLDDEAVIAERNAR